MLNEIVEEFCFVEELDALKTQYPRIYEVKDALSWTLARTPNAGTSLPGHPEWMVFETTSVGGPMPYFWVLYRFDASEEKVYLLSITPVVSEGDDSD